MSNRLENIITPKQEVGDITPRPTGGISADVGINNERMDLYSKLGTLSQDSGANSSSLQPLDLVTQDPQDLKKVKGAAPMKEANPVDFTIVDDFGNKQEVANKNSNSGFSKPAELIDRGFDASHGKGRNADFIDSGFDASHGKQPNTPFIDRGFDASHGKGRNADFIDRGFDISNDPGRLTPFIDHGFSVSNDSGRNAAHANDGFSVSEIVKEVPRPDSTPFDQLGHR